MTARRRMRPLALASMSSTLLAACLVAAPLPATAAPAAPGGGADLALSSAWAGVGACDLGLAQDRITQRVGSLYAEDGGTRFASENAKIGFSATSATALWVMQKRYVSSEGYVIVDGKGKAVWARTSEGYSSIDSVKPLKGPWAGITRIEVAGSSGNPDSAKGSRPDLLFGLTTSGQLVRMPLTWTKAGDPVVGKRQVLATGFRHFVTFAHNSWHGAKWVIAEDRFVGITTSGQFVQTTVTRGRTPKVTTKVLAKSGFSGVIGMTSGGCGDSGERGISWALQRSNGTVTSYVDPEYADNSLKGMKQTEKPLKVDSRYRLL